MNEDRIYSYNDISLSNLDSLAKEEGKMMEMRISELSFEAWFVCDDADKTIFIQSAG